MASFFRSDNLAWKPFGWAADVLMLSGLWFVCSVPIITMGAATCAMYDCVAHCVRGRDQAMFARFFRTLKRELLPALLTELFWAVLIAAAYSGIRVFGNAFAASDAAVIITAALLLLLVMLIGCSCWVYPLLSRFTFGFSALQSTALKLALSHPARTLFLGIITVLAGYLCLQLWIPFLFLPMVTALLWSFLLEPVFAPFVTKSSAES